MKSSKTKNESLNSWKKDKKSNKRIDIAIVGIACRYPDAKDYNEFWSNVAGGINSIKEVTKERWSIEQFYSKDINETNKTTSKWCGMLEDIDKFDNRFFNISPREASNMDPQQRIILEETYRCIQDSGINIKNMQQRKTAVYVGVSTSEYWNTAFSVDGEIDSYASLGNYKCVIPNRISSTFGFSGTSIAIDAACATSLVALHEAKQVLINGESDYALAASINLCLEPGRFIANSKARMLSPDGQCKTFDQDANGYVPGEGVGVLLLQRLDEAVVSGCHIYGVIKGTAVSHGGQSESITAPKVETQRQVILDAYNDAGVSPETVNYVEAHGTGTSLGDPIEIEALTQAFREYTNKENFCKIGSVKTNIGHLEPAAGLAGVIKVLMMMKHKKIVPSLNINSLNPIIDFESSPFMVATELNEWINVCEGVPLRAGVSSFGFAGVNSHVIIEEFCDTRIKEESEEVSRNLFVLSAKSKESLEKLIDTWRKFVSNSNVSDLNIRDTCLTLLHGRNSYNYRFGKCINDWSELVEILNETPNMYTPSKNGTKWILTIGNLTFNGYEIIRNDVEGNSVFAESIQKALSSLEIIDEDGSLRKGFECDVWDEKNHQLYSFILAYAYIKVLLDLGFYPDLVVSEDTGIWVSLVISGIVSFDEIIRLFAGRKKVEQIKLSRPVIPFYDVVNGQKIKPFVFSEEYISFMVNELNVQEGIVDGENIVQSYVEKARKLYMSQFTFKKFLEEWDVVLKQNNKNLHKMLYEDSLFSTSSDEFKNDKLLLMTILTSCMKRLNRKWRLKEKESVADKRFYEIVDLIVDGVMPKEIVVELLVNQDLDFSLISNILNNNQSKLNLNNSYTYLKEKNLELNEIDNFKKWLENATVIKSNLSFDDKSKSVYISTDNDSQLLDNTIKINLLKGEIDGFKENLLTLWMAGVPITWDKLYSEGDFKKVPLPGYEFIRKSFWLNNKKKDIQYMQTEKLHPLVGKNISTLEEQKFSLELSGEEFYLSDHKVGDQKFLPGVAHLEMVRAAAEIAGEKKVFKISNVVWSRPIVQMGRPTNLNIGIYPNGNAVDFQVWDLVEDERRVYSQGKLFYNNYEQNSIKNEQVDFSIIKKRCSKVLSNEECYDMFDRISLNYGKSFRTIENTYVGEDEALSLLKLPEECKVSDSSFILHPSIMDGALQTALCMINNPNSTYLPFVLGEVEIFGKLPHRCYSYVKQVYSLNITDTEVLKFNIHLYDEEGHVLVIMRDISFRKFNRHGVKNSNILRATPCWKKDEYSSENLTAIPQGDTLIFDNNEILWQELKRRHQGESGGTSENVVLVMKGEEFCDYGNNKYVINPKEKESYIKLFQHLSVKKQIPSNILHLWPEGDFCDNEKQLRKQLDEDVYSLLYIAQVVINNNYKKSIKLIYGYSNNHVTPQYAAVGGIAKTINMENSTLICKTVGFVTDSDNNSNWKLNTLLNELLKMEDIEVKYENRVRFKRSCIEKKEITRQVVKSPFFDNGVYLITGGMGGLGLVFAEHIAKKAKIKLVLIGRKELNTELHEKIEKLQSEGSEVLYIRADVTKKEDIEKVIKQVKSKYGFINGIIHSSGVIRDAYVNNKTRKEMEDVIGSKVFGTILLDKLTREEPLEFFVTFSSIVGFVGNTGQCDYSYANSFMDFYAYLREHDRKEGKANGKTLSINWPLWKEGGMKVDNSTEILLENRFGMRPLSTAVGLEEFDKALSEEECQIIIMEGNSGKIRSLFELTSKKDNTNLKVYENYDSGIFIEENYSQRISDNLIAGVSEILRINIEEIDIEAGINELGFDSIALTQYSNYINEKFNLDIIPSVFFEFSTLGEFIDYVKAEYKDQIKMHYSNTLNYEEAAITTINTNIDEQKFNVFVSAALIEGVSEILKIDTRDIDRDSEFSELGFDSISFTQYSNVLNEKYNLSVIPSMFFEYPTLDTFTEFVSDNFESEMKKYYKVSTKTENNIKDEETVRIDRKPRFQASNYIRSTIENKVESFEDIAIIGMAGVMPQSEDLEELWGNLNLGKDLISEVPSDRWDWKSIFGDPTKEVNKTNIKWGGFMKEVDKFDAQFFGISPREAELMDPQQRIFLETVWKTIEDSGYKASDLAGTKTGVYVGAATGDYKELLMSNGIDIQAQTSTGMFHSITANRISYLMNFKGPSESIDTACSSALVAIHHAVEAIRNGDCDLAIAGGVNVMATPTLFISFSKAGMLANDGRCKTFDKRANGYVRGEGTGAVLLKPISKAIKDKDHIYAVIKGSAVNHGGRANSLTAPNPNAQADLIYKAWKRSGVDPTTISYIEAHGTGTSLGDPIEITGLKKAFQNLYKDWDLSNPKKEYCAVGSVKTNFGHLETASGIAGLIKVILSMKNETILGNLNFQELNPYIDLNDSPFYITDKNKPWKRFNDELNNLIPRRAGISSFGFGGVNSHIAIEEYIDASEITEERENVAEIFVLSAKNEVRLMEYAKRFKSFLEEEVNRSSPHFKDICYTLQVGRENMQERIAIIASSIEELMEKLQAFCSGKMLENVYRGNVKSGKLKYESLLTGKSGELFINNITMNCEHTQIAELWVNGYDLDWFKVYTNRNARRLSLPKYPFARDRYWIPQQMTVNSLTSTNGIAKLHTMIDSNESTLEEQCFKKVLNKIEFYLKDHVVNEKITLPGVAYLEMARVAGQFSWKGKTVSKLKDIIWTRPIFIDKEEKDIYIGIYPEGKTVSFKIYSKEKTDTMIYAQGKIVYSEETIEANEVFDITSIKDRCKKIKLGEEYYDIFAERGFKYGPSFQAIEEIYSSEKEALSLMSMPSGIEGKYEDIVLHPSILDGALQTSLSVLQDIGEEDTIYLPFSIRELEIYKPLTKECYAYVSLANEHGNIDEKIFNIYLIDKSGNILIKLNGFTVRKYTKDSGEKNNEVYISRDWKLSESEIRIDLSDFIGNILLFDNDEEILEEFRKRFPNSKVVLVSQSTEYKEICESRFVINPENKEDYITLFQTLNSRGLIPEKIIHRWSAKEFNIDSKIINNQIRESAYSILYAVQAMMDQEINSDVNLLYVYNRKDYESFPQYEAVGGILKTLGMESTRYTCKILSYDYSSKNPEQTVAMILDEINSKGTEVKYDGMNRWEKGFREIKAESIYTQEGLIPYKENGVYLITGGAGGLGLMFAKFIASKVKAKIVLTGRSELDELRKGKLRAIEDLGSELIYIKGDISDQKETKRLIANIKSKFNRIDGVIHSAGVIKDTLIKKKSHSDIEAVIGPKVYGTVWLDKYTRGENLDFFVMFSSVAAVTGNVGQSDYAYANAFMDSYALYREALVKQDKAKGKTISFNWPLWKSGGMKVNVETERHLLHTLGIKPLSTEVGLEAFSKAMKMSESQLIVLEGEGAKIRKVFNVNKNENKVKYTENSMIDGLNENKLLHKVEQNLIECVSEILKMDEKNIDLEMEMSDFGFDSISFTQLSNLINDKYDIGIMPSIFFEYPTLNSLANYLVQKYSDKISINYKDELYTFGSELTIEQNTSKIRSAFEVNKVQSKTEDIKNILNENELSDKVAESLVKCVSEILKISENDIDFETDISDYGFDSITFTQFSNILNDKYDIGIMPSIFFEHSTLSSLINYLIQKYNDKISIHYKDEVCKLESKQKQYTKKVTVEEAKSNQGFNRFMRDEGRIVSRKENSKEVQANISEPIAIIGISGVMPQSRDLNAFWENLILGKDMISEIPKERWDWKKYYGDPLSESNKTNVKWGGFMDEIDKFDPMFFGISPKEALFMDPQHRIFLETVWKTIEDAGYRAADLSGTKTGVFVGVGGWDYSDILATNSSKIEAQMATGMTHSVLANRISYILNLNGPSEPVDTACSSSLVAIHRAINSIRNGDCDLALVGGVNVIATPKWHISFNKSGMLSEDGRCKTFDKKANGYVRSEGVGAVLLKPLSKAVSDGDSIYAVIKGTAVNHGGRANSLTAPNPNAQAEVIQTAWKKSKIDPSTITYIEAHGTGTSLGDPIEVNGLKKAFENLYNYWGKPIPVSPYCGIGSVKTNIGHLETAAGIAGLIKVILSMKHGVIPGNIHMKEINPYIDIKNSPLYILKENRVWERMTDVNGSEIPRRAGVSSFGFGGVNAHVVLEEYESTTEMTVYKEEPQLFILSARNEERLKEYSENLLKYLGEQISLREEKHMELKSLVASELKLFLSEVINIQPEIIDENENIQEYNIDHVQLSEFCQKVMEYYKIDDLHAAMKSYSSLSEYAFDLCATCTEDITRKYPNYLNPWIKNIRGSKVSLEDITYTLQVGRNPMDSRLAIIASSIDELHSKLYQYISGDKNIKNVITGNAKEEKEDYQLLLQGDEGKQFLKSVINNKNLLKLAKLWVVGVNIDWTLMHKSSVRRRVSIPTYPFAKERYWVELNDKNENIRELKTVEANKISQSSEVYISNNIEETLMKIWSEILGVKVVKPKDNFMELGGNSITAMQIISQIKTKFSIQISPSKFLELSCIKLINEYIEKELQKQEASSEIETEEQVTVEGNYTQTIPMREVSSPVRLSSDQERLWLLSKINTNNIRHNIPILFEVEGDINFDILNKSFTSLIQRHESLRTTFGIDGEKPVQIIHDKLENSIGYIDLQHLQEGERRGEAISMFQKYAKTPFDLDNGPLVKLYLMHIGNQTYMLSVIVHHIIADIWSVGILLQQLFRIYNDLLSGKSVSMSEKTIQFADYVKFQNDKEELVLQEQLNYWKNTLKGIPEFIEFQIDRPRPEKQSFKAGMVKFDIPQDIYDSIKNLAQENKTSTYVIMLTVFYTLLNRVSGQEDIVIGSPAANRRIPETNDMIGLFANILIVRNKVSKEITFAELIKQVKVSVYEAFDWQDVPYGKIVDALQPKRASNYNPLFQVMFNWVVFPDYTEDGFKVNMVDEQLLTTDFDLTLRMEERNSIVHGFFDYSSDLYDRSTVEVFAKLYINIMKVIAENTSVKISDIDILSKMEDKSSKLKTEEKKHTIAIAATFTAEPIKETIEFWMKRLEVSTKVEFAPYNQVFQQLLDPQQIFHSNHYGVNVVMLRFGDWIRDNKSVSDKERHKILERNLADFICIVKTASLQSSVPLLIVLCPSDSDEIITDCDFEKELQNMLVEGLSGLKKVYIILPEEIATKYPTEVVFDKQANKVGHVPFTEEYFTSVGTMISRKVHAVQRAPYKVIVLDCDQTLWKGVCGEGHTAEIEVDHARERFQKMLLEQASSGMLLCLCSKNEERDVLNAFEQLKQMPLKLENIVSWKVNWRPKSENIMELARELNLGLDSFVFIDDNPVEIAEVNTNCRGVFTIQFPQSPEEIDKLLNHIWIFDKTDVTKEDITRSEMYKQEIMRKQSEKELPSFGDFIENLNLNINISFMLDEDLGRVEQLMQRTNQFNTTTLRYTAEEIRTMINSGKSKCMTVRVKDRFGDYGLVGVIFYSTDSEKISIDSFILSCRAMGKGVEHKMISKIGDIVVQSDIKSVAIRYIKSERNTPAKAFLDSIEADLNENKSGEIIYQMSSQAASKVIFHTKNDHKESDALSENRNVKVSIRPATDVLQSIPSTFSSTLDIVSAIKHEKSQDKVSIHDECNLNMTEVERKIVSIFKDVLKVDKIQMDSNFFDLGGTSLLLVMLSSKLKESFNKDLDITDLFKYSTVKALAAYLGNDGVDNKNLSKARSRGAKQRSRLMNFRKS